MQCWAMLVSPVKGQPQYLQRPAVQQPQHRVEGNWKHQGFQALLSIDYAPQVRIKAYQVIQSLKPLSPGDKEPPLSPSKSAIHERTQMTPQQNFAKEMKYSLNFSILLNQCNSNSIHELKQE
ncbi:hypothetical protein SDJN03_10941, partial [Cucurbita argyrosperma subsp. sororia]